VATDGAGMYGSERERIAARDFPDGFDLADAAETFGRWMLGTGTDNLLETTLADRNRIFDLGYYTWVEQQGISLADFEARRDQRFWTGLRDLLPAWDAMITEFNERTGLAEAG
jgi:cysteine synthase